MKQRISQIIFTSILTIHASSLFAEEDISQYLEKKTVATRLRDEVAALDIKASLKLVDIDVVDGINLSSKYKYEVETSYQDQYFTRIDKWDVNAGINVGDLVNNFVELPFSFSVNRNTSFLFVRQFKSKKEAIKAIPYSPKRLPLNADLVLKNLDAGDFVSMPANLNIAVEARATSTMVAPVILSATAGAYYIVSGEFTIQVFKIDESRVRLKMISARGSQAGVSAGVGMSFDIFGVRLLDKQITRIMDRGELAQYGLVSNPGAQFILDYVFDLKHPESKEAYDQILNTTLKFKDTVVFNKIDNANELKDKLITSFDKAEKIFETDRALPPKDRRVSRIFKGLNDFTGSTKKVKLSVVLASYKKDRAFTDSKVTFIDKNENNLEFYYPSYSKYIEGKIGKGLIELKDQSYQNNFGLIPKFNSEDVSRRNPDFGVTFERRDKFFSDAEQKIIRRFMAGQIPTQFDSVIDYGPWKDYENKSDTRIFFQLVLKAEGFNYLRALSADELYKKLTAYTDEKRKFHNDEDGTSEWQKLKDFLLIERIIREDRLKSLAQDLSLILSDDTQNSEGKLRKLVKLNESGIFNKIGVGFLISLLPQDKLESLIYLNLEMAGQKIKPVHFEYGKLNYRALYNELTIIQSRIANRSYDLRITEQDNSLESTDIYSEKQKIEEQKLMEQDALGAFIYLNGF